jgi:DNA polymerase
MANSGDDAAGKRTKKAAAQRLESLGRAGVTNLPRPRRPAKPTAVAAPVETPARQKPAALTVTPATPAAAAVALTQKVAQSAVSPAAQPSSSGESNFARLEVIRQEVVGCTRCPELASTRTQTVFGVGNPQARLCFLGEAPGADEDKRGEPFVGRAGQLLTKIIEACTLKREDVYILNVLKCRPPDNRTPLPDEVANCRGYLDRQLEVIRPEFICCLGGVAAQRLLDTTDTIGRLRKRFFERGGIKIICTYHPAYLLRNPAAKREVWDDMKMLMREMGVELS